jgi:hypothetical protein
LKGPYRMSLAAVLHDWPRAECAGHELLQHRRLRIPHL